MYVGTESVVAGLDPLPSNSGPNLLQRPEGGEVLLGHGDFCRNSKGLPLKNRLRTREDDFLRLSSVWFRMIGAFLVNICLSQFVLLQNVVFTQATLAEREKVNAELLERIEVLSAKRRQADDKLASLQAELDRKSVARRGQEGELDRLWGGAGEREVGV